MIKKEKPRLQAILRKRLQFQQNISNLFELDFDYENARKILNMEEESE